MIRDPNIDPLHHPDLERAVNQYPFEAIVEKYSRYEYPLDSNHLNELVVELMTSDYLKQLQNELEQRPQLSALYRYDPFTLSSSDTWGGRVPNGPKTAWLRMFKDLSFDDVYVTRTATEALVFINKPSILVSAMNSAKEDTEPTVLFTSNMLKLSAYDIGEQDTLGMTLTHGDSIHAVLPKGELTSASINLGYYGHEREQRNKLAEPSE